MNLKEIQEQTCETCGAIPVMESVEVMHCNGHYFETRKFACGRTIRFIPNYMEIRVSSECPSHPDIQSQEGKREKAREAIQDFIGGLDVDDDFKSSLSSHLRALGISINGFR